MVFDVSEAIWILKGLEAKVELGRPQRPEVERLLTDMLATWDLEAVLASIWGLWSNWDQFEVDSGSIWYGFGLDLGGFEFDLHWICGRFGRRFGIDLASN